MQTPTLAATGELAHELFDLLRDTDPTRWSDSVAQRARERWTRIRSKIERLSVGFEQRARSRLDDALVHLAALARESDVAEDHASPKSHWMELRARLMPAYERLAGELRARAVRVPTLRPTNGYRIAFHVTSAFGALILLEVVLSKRGTIWATGAFAGTCWLLETTRALSLRWNDVLMRVKFFQLIIHPHERHKVNSATWYGTALLMLALLSPPLCSATALAVLGVGDPVAGLVGRRWGKHPVGAGRTLEGSLAFVLAGWLAAFGVLAVWHRVGAWPLLAVVALVSAIAGGVAEAASQRVDDNLSVPLAAALAAGISSWSLAVPL
jgi:dolichol kinase